MTYQQNQRQQRKFIRFLVAKLHIINSMSDELHRDFLFDQGSEILGAGTQSYEIFVP